MAVAAIAAMVSAKRSPAAVLFDNISSYEGGTSGAGLTYTTVTPNSFMADAYVLTAGATDITGFDLFPVNGSTKTLTGLQLNIYVWGMVSGNGVTTSAPAFSDLLGDYSVDSSGSFTPGKYYPFEGSPPGSTPNFTLKTPIQLDGSAVVGITVNIEGTTNGVIYQNSNNLTSAISYGVGPTVGSEVFNGYYRNANNETSGNFTSPIKYLIGDNVQSLALRIFGDINTVASNQWLTNTGGDWATPDSWSTSNVPTATSDASFDRSSSNYTVTVSSPALCEDLYVQSDNVTLDLSAIGSSLAIGGTLGVGQPTVGGSTVNGILNLTHSYGGTSANVSAGSVAIGGNGSTGILTIGTSVTLTAVTASIASGSSLIIATGGKLVAPAISVAGTTDNWTGLLDIGTTALDLPAASLATVTNQVKQGFNQAGGGDWNGSAGITSSAAANDSAHLTAVGAIVNNNGTGSPLYGLGGGLGTFGTSNPGLNDVLVRYTYYGDANLDGKVDGTDYSLIDNGYLRHLTGWFNGDFNYDGIVDGSDYTLIDNAFNSQGAALIADAEIAPAAITSVIASVTEQTGYSTMPNHKDFDATASTPDEFALSTTVPEPTTMKLVLFALLVRALLGVSKRNDRTVKLNDLV